MANQGINFGLHRTCRLKAMEKFDLEAAVAALRWIEKVNGQQLSSQDVGTVKNDHDVAELLKDGTALCELMNHIKPGAIRKYHKTPSAFQQMENAELFLRACLDYGMQTIDTFPVKELYEARAVYTVVNCIYALGSLAQQNGYSGPKLGPKLAARNERQFSEEQIQQARRSVSRQHSVPSDTPSQAHMTPYGLPRQILLTGHAAVDVASSSHSVIGLQYGSNQVASQAGMTAYGMPRQISISASSEGDNNPDIDDDTTVKPIATPEATTTTSNSDKASTKSISTMTDGDDTQTAISPTTNNPILNAAKSPSRRIKATGDAASVIGLQYGSNRVASQAGMTAMGMPRQIVSSTSSATSAEDDGEKAEVFERAKKT